MKNEVRGLKDEKDFIILIVLSLFIFLFYSLSNKNIKEEKKEEEVNIESKTILPIAVNNEIKLLDLKSNSLLSIPGDPKGEVVFGESVDEKWLIISEGKREVAERILHQIFFSLVGIYIIE